MASNVRKVLLSALVMSATLFGATVGVPQAAAAPQIQNNVDAGSPAAVPVGRQPSNVAVDPSAHTAYVTNSGGNTVSLVVGYVVVGSITVGNGPTGVAVDPGTHTAYVACSDGTVAVIDTRTQSVVRTLALGGLPGGVAIDTATHLAYVANADRNVVSVIAGDEVIRTIAVGFRPRDVGVDPGTHSAYVANSDGTVSIVDTGTFGVSRTIRAGFPSYSQIAVDSTNHRAYVSEQTTVAEIDTTTGSVTHTINTPGTAYGVAVDPTGNRLYATTLGGSLSAFDTNTRTEIQSYLVGSQPKGVAVDVTNRNVFTVDTVGYVAVIDRSVGTGADKVGPVIERHDSVWAIAPGPAGVAVSYTTPTALDAVDGPVPVTCSPPSGSIFPVDLNTVTCTAMDKSGNYTISTFSVSVPPSSVTYPPGTVITIPPVVEQGGAVAVLITGWAPNTQVSVTLDRGDRINTITTDASGNAVTALNIPADAYVGPHNLVVETGWGTNVPGGKSFAVSAPTAFSFSQLVSLLVRILFGL